MRRSCFSLASKMATPTLISNTRITSSLCSLHARTAPSQVRTVYHERVIDHYEKPRNVGSLPDEDPDVGTGLVGAPACGDVMRLQVKIKDGIIEEAVFKTFGCGSAIASSSLATEWIKGKSVDTARTIKNKDIAKHLSLPPVKLHCSMLAEDAIKASIKNWELKQKKKDQTEVDAPKEQDKMNA
eukprot:TRINITY_DN6157_c0_g1_i4.p1 TRINITY_DN6157_c0_g1~~TRINITY_DN6157_c0_g1_i4.p1  ORF type:complete len:184 (+),score=40.18 TRINITY_DN6157_c0_g1_i4:71-622(+)